jgi:hypothetical protein
MRHRIVGKLEKAGATSMQKAVTTEEARFDLQEQQWLSYVAGGFFSEVKKTKDQRYYV